MGEWVWNQRRNLALRISAVSAFRVRRTDKEPGPFVIEAWFGGDEKEWIEVERFNGGRESIEALKELVEEIENS